MAGYGVCIGVLGALRAQSKAFFEVSALEVKMASVGKKTATKREMIQWAHDLYPKANWPFYKKGGQEFIVEGKAEHMADAIATVHAGIVTPSYQQLALLL